MRFVILARREYYVCEYSGSFTRNAFHKTRAVRNSCSKGNIDRSKSALEKKAKIYVHVWKNTRNAFLKVEKCGSRTKLNRYSLDALYARHGSRSCKILQEHEKVDI